MTDRQTNGWTNSLIAYAALHYVARPKKIKSTAAFEQLKTAEAAAAVVQYCSSSGIVNMKMV